MIPKGTFRSVGGAIGGVLGGPTGALAGRMLGRGLAGITGYGDYTVSQNSIIRNGGTADSGDAGSIDSLPQFRKGKHNISVCHREYWKDLKVPVLPEAYNVETQVISPSNAALFPWLASMAKQYQMYRIKGMVVEYKSNTSDYAASGPLGVVGIATNYNVIDLPYPNLVAFENSEFAVVTKPSRNILHAIECAPQSGRDEWLYIRDIGNENPLLINDPRFSDFARLQVATSGLPGTPGTTLGQLWISYDIEFSKPVIPSAGASLVTYTGRVLTSKSDGTVGTGLNKLGQTAVANGDCMWTMDPGTLVRVFNPNEATWEQDSGIIGPGRAVELLPNGFHLRAPGKYVISLRIYGHTTSTNYTLQDIGVLSGRFGASYNDAVGSHLAQGRWAHACLAGTSSGTTYGYDCTVSINVTVDSLQPITGAVFISMPDVNVYAAGVVVIPTWECRVRWDEVDTAQICLPP